MKILFSDLEQSETTYPLVDDGWFPTEEFTVVDVPCGQTTAMLTGSNEALIKGKMSCQILFSCDRCCAEVKLKLAVDFAYICMLGSEELEQGQQETECRVEDYNRLYLKEPVIDLGEVYREQVYLSVPSQILCHKSCRGLCQACGADLNQTRCDCDRKEQDSPFAILRQLKNH
ncbi:MAG: DUF177 domain-containing protein [Desulfocapsaceae bacterium]